MQEMFDQRLDRRETGAARNEDHGPFGVLARHESSKRAFHAQRRAIRQIRENAMREIAAGDMAHMQLDLRPGVRRIGDRERTAFAARQQHVQVLAGQAIERCIAWCASCRRITSGASRVFSTSLSGSTRRGMSATDATSRAAMTKFERGTAWHSST